jgi:hypothetical protein
LGAQAKGRKAGNNATQKTALSQKQTTRLVIYITNPPNFIKQNRFFPAISILNPVGIGRASPLAGWKRNESDGTHIMNPTIGKP